MKITDHNNNKYITTPEFDNLAARVFNTRLAQADLVAKRDFDVRLQSLKKKINSNKTKHLLVETEFKKLEKFDAAYSRGKNYFDVDSTQNYLVFQPMYKYFKTFVEDGFTYISSWESKELSNKKINSIKTSNYEKSSRLVCKLNFSVNILKQDKITYKHGPTVNIYTVYKLTPKDNAEGVTLENCLLSAVKLPKNADIDKYKYSGYGIGFDSKGRFTHLSRGYDKNVIIFGTYLSSSTHANNKTRYILFLGKDFIQEIDGTAIYAKIAILVCIIMAIIAIYLSMPKKLLILKLKTLKVCHIRCV